MSCCLSPPLSRPFLLPSTLAKLHAPFSPSLCFSTETTRYICANLSVRSRDVCHVGCFPWHMSDTPPASCWLQSLHTFVLLPHLSHRHAPLPFLPHLSEHLALSRRRESCCSCSPCWPRWRTLHHLKGGPCCGRCRGLCEVLGSVLRSLPRPLWSERDHIMRRRYAFVGRQSCSSSQCGLASCCM